MTYPFKEAAFQLVAPGVPAVARLGAVNTILLDPGRPPRGLNTDHSGLVNRWRRNWAGVGPGTVALVGAGGVGRAIAFALVDLGATGLRIVDSDPDRAATLAAAVADHHPGFSVERTGSTMAAVTGVDGIVNATPVGMHFSPGTPVPLEAVAGQRWLLDAVYSPARTALVARAEAAGVRVFGGVELFLGQAFDAFHHFAGRPVPAAAAPEVEAELVRLLAEGP